MTDAEIRAALALAERDGGRLHVDEEMRRTIAAALRALLACREALRRSKKEILEEIGERLVLWDLETIEADWTPEAREAAGHVLAQIANVLFGEARAALGEAPPEAR